MSLPPSEYMIDFVKDLPDAYEKLIEKRKNMNIFEIECLYDKIDNNITQYPKFSSTADSIYIPNKKQLA